MFDDFIVPLHSDFICSLVLKIKENDYFANDSHLEIELIVI